MIHHLGSAIDLFIHPGEYEFADENFCIRTTLGSCVSIVMWHPKRRYGGMCHFMLPSRARLAESAPSGKYADEALDLMLGEALKVGTRPQDYCIKLFGGGNMFPGERHDGITVATRNINSVRKLLEDNGLTITSESLGGNGYRNIVFDIARGDVWVRHVTYSNDRKKATIKSVERP